MIELRRFARITGMIILVAIAIIMLPGINKKAYADDDVTIVYRLYTPVNGEHLYTTDSNEVRVLTARYGWKNEGIGWYAPSNGTPVYRLYNEGLRNHLYTTDTNEVKVLTTRHGWKLDNNGKPLFYSGGSVEIYRLYNEGLSGMHLLTTDTNEYKVIPAYGWKQEGTKLYASSDAEGYGEYINDKYYSYEGFRTDLDMEAKQLILNERVKSTNINAYVNPTWNEHLYKVAQARAKEIVTNFSHDSAYAKSGYSTAEALTMFTFDKAAGNDGAKIAIYNWSNSPDHYDIMVSGDQFAVACYQKGNYQYWVCLCAYEKYYIAENSATEYADRYIREWKTKAEQTWEEAYKKHYSNFVKLHGKRNIW